MIMWIFFTDGEMFFPSTEAQDAWIILNHAGEHNNKK